MEWPDVDSCFGASGNPGDDGKLDSKPAELVKSGHAIPELDSWFGQVSENPNEGGKPSAAAWDVPGQSNALFVESFASGTNELPLAMAGS